MVKIGVTNVLKGVISEYIAYIILRDIYKDQHAIVLWHPNYRISYNYLSIKHVIEHDTSDKPSSQYFYNYLKREVKVITGIGVRNGIKKIPLIDDTELKLISFNKFLNVIRNSIDEKLYIQLNSIVNMFIKGDMLELLEALNILASNINIIQYIKKDLYLMIEQKLKKLNMGRKSQSKTGHTFMNKEKELKKTLETIKLISKRYLTKMANSDIRGLLLYMLLYNKNIALNLLKEQKLHIFKESIIRHLNIASKLISSNIVGFISSDHDIVVIHLDDSSLKN